MTPSRLIICFVLLALALVPAVADADGSVRRSAYALDAATAAAHPEWVLKDSFGNRLYVGPSFAADIGNPAYRAWWIAQVAGVSRLYVDDVSMERRVYRAGGSLATPRDPRTGTTMSETKWQRYMADFMVQLRAALPAAEIVHDVLWYKGDTRTDVLRELNAADALALENGFDDPAVLTYGWETLAGWIERRDRPVVLGDGTPYARGAALLFGSGDADLGAPTSARTWWNGVWRRDFANGIVLVNPAGAPTVTVAIEDEIVTLAPASAAVRVRVPVAPTPTATPTPEATPEPVVATPTPAPRKPVRRSATAHIAGAAAPKATRTTVAVSRLSVWGKVSGAVSGYVRVHVQRKRGTGWLTVRRVKPSVSRRGTFKVAIARLRRGSYRALARFEGTGTALPSRAEPKLRSL